MTRIITGLILLIIVTHGHMAMADDTNNSATGPITYVAYMEENLGFYRVIDVTTYKDPSYKERVLTISQGDTVIWLNDADTAILTVVSEEDLWDKSESRLRPPNRRFNYTFMMSGTYSMYMDEYKNLVHQTIIVNPKEGYPTPTPIPTQSPIPTPVPTKNIVSTPVSEYCPVDTTVPKNATDPIIDLILSRNSTIGSKTNTSRGKMTNTDMTGVGILDIINTMSNLILSLSVMAIAYKVWRDY